MHMYIHTYVYTYICVCAHVLNLPVELNDGYNFSDVERLWFSKY